jgi:alpha-beta hydrolase superfamily lysophospholipase
MISAKAKRKLIRALQVTVAIYCVTGIVLWQLQESLIFHPTPLAADYQFWFEQPFREVLLPLDEKDRLSIIQFKTPDTTHIRGIVLYFHGNRENINRYEKYAPNFTKHGYEVWMIDYPGYGKTTGKKTEQRFYKDAALLYKMASVKISNDSIIIYGKSLGTGVASELAAQNECKRLILETPYYSISSLGWYHFPIYPVERMCRYKFPVYVYLQETKATVTILHGTKDQVIPYRHAKKLVNILKPGDEFITIQGGQHNNLNDFELFHQKLDSVLKQ